MQVILQIPDPNSDSVKTTTDHIAVFADSNDQ